MEALGRGVLDKMRVTLDAPVSYSLPVGEILIPLNQYIHKTLRLEFTGQILCTHCGRKTKKSFNQGYCYPCFTRLAQCDSCIISPEKCHFHLGTCREPEWAMQYCMQDHIVYLANSSGIKVGITRADQVPTRWIDQGAVQAMPIFRVQTRQQAGLVEDKLRQHVPDKTNWRTMLKGELSPIDLPLECDKLLSAAQEDIAQLQQRFGLQAIQALQSPQVIEINYPVKNHPSKITSLDLDKTPVIEGVLMGIKGQYLLFDSGVINIRKYTAYETIVAA